MKKFLLVFVIGVQILSAEKLPLRDQLIALNKNWQNKSVPQWLYDSVAEQLNDVQLIQLHLGLVEKSLRTSRNAANTTEQQSKRAKRLDALHAYAQKGVFPKNYHFNHRQPVFIDEHGTYCAVGELIRESGQDALAQKVHSENNFGYIRELEKHYSALGEWATENGFAIDELAWIQPCYGPWCTDTVGFAHPTCYKAQNGYFRPDYLTFKTPKSKVLYKLVNGTWTTFVNSPCNFIEHCWLDAGHYKWDVVDSMDVLHTFTATLIAPDSAVVTISQLGDFSACAGTVIVTPSGGAAPYKYRWQNETTYSKDSTRTGFCEQTILVAVREFGWYLCEQTFIFFPGHTGLPENNLKKIELMPNPFDSKVKISNLLRGSELKLVNSSGKTVYTATVNGPEFELELSTLSSGIYFYELKTNSEIIHGKLIKR